MTVTASPESSAPEADSAIALLKAKAMLLLRRERELFEFRLARDRVETWLEVFHALSEMIGITDEGAVLTKCADMLIDHLGFESVAIFRHKTGGAALEPVCVRPSDRAAAPIPIAGTVDPLLRKNHGTHESAEIDGIDRIGSAAELEKYYWLTFPIADDLHHLLVAGFSPNAAAFHTLSGSDQGHFVMFGSHLAALISNSQLVEEVHRERLELLVANDELDASLRELRKTQDELVQSTRLASVGEMAGRMAHEVLNPITSIHGRITRMLRGSGDVFEANVQVLADIVDGWRASLAQGGAAGLVASLEELVDDGSGGTRTLLDDDLANLAALYEYFARHIEEDAEGLQFLLRETDRVTRIIDGTRSLTRHSGTRERLTLVDLLTESGEALYDGLQKRNISLEIDCERDIDVHVDRYELIQVLTNLMRNSMFAIEEKNGREGGTIGLRSGRNGDVVEIRVDDSGSGIAPEHLPVIFESHFTTRSAHNGTGLGLSICKRLVRGFGGELSVERTEIGVGSTFLIALPAYAATEQAVIEEDDAA